MLQGGVLAASIVALSAMLPRRQQHKAPFGRGGGQQQQGSFSRRKGGHRQHDCLQHHATKAAAG